MALHVCSGATLKCSFGLAPSTLVVLPTNQLMTGHRPAATIMDHISMVNIMPFGLCTSLSNPAVAAATSAAQGTLTPQPCIPVTPSPWVPGAASVILGHQPALNDNCKLMCSWAGVIEVVAPGQSGAQIP